MSILRDITDVAGIKPTVLDHLGSRFRLAVIASHHVRAANQNLTVFSDLELDSFERNAHRSDVIIAGAVRTDDACLSRTIPLKNRNSRREVRIRERRRERRTARNEIPQTPANTRAPLRKHQFAGKPLLDPQSRRDPLSFVFELAVALAHRERTHEDRLLVAFLGHAFFDDPVIDLFKQSRDGRHHGRRNFAQVLAHLLHRRGVVNRHAAIAENVEPVSFKDVRQRQH